jgi:hypothetical protein
MTTSNQGLRLDRQSFWIWLAVLFAAKVVTGNIALSQLGLGHSIFADLDMLLLIGLAVVMGARFLDFGGRSWIGALLIIVPALLASFAPIPYLIAIGSPNVSATEFANLAAIFGALALLTSFLLSSTPEPTEAPDALAAAPSTSTVNAPTFHATWNCSRPAASARASARLQCSYRPKRPPIRRR